MLIKKNTNSNDLWCLAKNPDFCLENRPSREGIVTQKIIAVKNLKTVFLRIY